MATCGCDNARRATLAGMPSHSTQACARHRERSELIFFFLSIFSLISTEHHVDAITVTSLHSGFHRPQHRSLSSSAAVAILFSSHLLASVATVPDVSFFSPPPTTTSTIVAASLPSSSLRFHRLHPDTTSPASPSLSTVLAIHRRDPPSLLHLPSSVPISGCASLHFVPHRRLPLSASPTSPASLSLPSLFQPSIAVALHHRHPPLRLVAERHCRSLPYSSALTTITSTASTLSSFFAFSLHFALHPGEAISVFVHRHGLLHC